MRDEGDRLVARLIDQRRQVLKPDLDIGGVGVGQLRVLDLETVSPQVVREVVLPVFGWSPILPTVQDDDAGQWLDDHPLDRAEPEYRDAMLPLPNLLAFLAAAIVLVVMPGPTVLFVVGRSIALGRRVGLLSVLGNAIGLIPVVVAVAFGVGAIVMQSEIVFTILKFVGARRTSSTSASRRSGTAGKQPKPSRPGRARRSRRCVCSGEGFLVGVSNPKSIAFFVAVLPQFVAPEVGWVPGQMLLLGAIFVGLALISDGAWAFAAGTARDWFARSPKRVERLGATGGVMMIGLGGVLALTGAKD